MCLPLTPRRIQVQKYPDDAGPEFQSRCLGQLQEALATELYRLEGAEKVESSTEVFHRAGLRGTDLSVYIYDDGAGIQGLETDRRFEWQDYDSLDELCDEFVQEVVTICRRADQEEG